MNSIQEKEITVQGVRLYVRSDGRIFSHEREYVTKRYGKVFRMTFPRRELQMITNKDGYYIVRLNVAPRTRRTVTAHRIVALAFLENKKNLPCINHKNENKKDNRVENLEWCSVMYNNHYNNRYARIKHNYKKVVKFTKEMKFVERFNSIKEAAKSVNGDPSNIGSCCHFRFPCAYGFIWRFDIGDESVLDTNNEGIVQ